MHDVCMHVDRNRDIYIIKKETSLNVKIHNGKIYFTFIEK